ncbi:MAG: hypothetical protein AB1437_07500 [Pseudomonadota bacterium]
MTRIHDGASSPAKPGVHAVRSVSMAAPERAERLHLRTACLLC